MLLAHPLTPQCRYWTFLVADKLARLQLEKEAADRACADAQHQAELAAAGEQRLREEVEGVHAELKSSKAAIAELEDTNKSLEQVQ